MTQQRNGNHGSAHLNDSLVHHTIDEEVPFSGYSREVRLVGEDLIHPKDPQVVFQIDAVSTKSEFGHVKHEALHAVGKLAEEFLERWQRRWIKKLR